MLPFGAISTARRLLPLLLSALPTSACLSTSTARGPAEPPAGARNAMTDLQAQVFTDPDSGLALPYRLFVPPACTPEMPCGMLLFLHGAGERGSDNQSQLGNDALGFIGPATQAENPTIVVFPQCPPDMQWVDAAWADGSYALARTPISQPMAAALRLLALLQAKFPVDPHRLLVTGLSMGGFGAWDIVARHPTMFAGALALCGGGDPSAAPAIRDVPVWAFHGDQDPAVPVRGSREMIRALRKAGGNPRYTEVAGGGHTVWTIAYRDVEVIRWLLSQRRAP
jgi:predicted peptidase